MTGLAFNLIVNDSRLLKAHVQTSKNLFTFTLNIHYIFTTDLLLRQFTTELNADPALQKICTDFNRGMKGAQRS